MIFTYELNGSWKVYGQVLGPVIGDGDLQVLNVTRVLEHVWQIGSHVQDVLEILQHQNIQLNWSILYFLSEIIFLLMLLVKERE